MVNGFQSCVRCGADLMPSTDYAPGAWLRGSYVEEVADDAERRFRQVEAYESDGDLCPWWPEPAD
jgi:hypothetical protein